MPEGPKLRKAEPIKAPTFHNNSYSAWGSESDYDRPSPEYLARFTRGPISNERDVKRTMNRKLQTELGRYGRTERAADRRLRRNMKRPLELGRRSGR